jgi:hypothetical protein
VQILLYFVATHSKTDTIQLKTGEKMITKSDNATGFSLTFTNGDVEKFNAVMQKFNFIDAQAFIRFASSVLLETKDSVVGIIQHDNSVRAVSPQKDLLKK